MLVEVLFVCRLLMVPFIELEPITQFLLLVVTEEPIFLALQLILALVMVVLWLLDKDYPLKTLNLSNSIPLVSMDVAVLLLKDLEEKAVS